MSNETIEKLCTMIRSHDKEMVELAIAMFCGSTKDYQDYWLLRTTFNPDSVFLPTRQNEVFGRLYASLDSTTIDPFLKKMRGLSPPEIHKKLGKIELVKRSCVLATKKEQKDARKSFKH